VQFWFTKNKLSLQDHMSFLGLVPVFKSKSAQLISISIDQDYTNWKNYIETTKLNWPQYMENKVNLVTDFLYIDNFPTYMILDQKGNIIKTYFALKQVKEHFGIK
jgi:alkyl hydroperoxide reductase subunit AhpC